MSSCGPPRAQRRDARRNRERLTAAAREVFAARGLDAPLEEIARRAGVSVGTLYNHFATRETLIDEIVPELIDAQLALGEEALARPDPWEGFVWYVTRLCASQAADRGLTDALSMRFSDTERLAAACAQGTDQVARIVARARDGGGLRPDFTAADLVSIIWSTGRLVEATGAIAPGAWRRSLAFVLDGLRAEAAHPIAEPALTSEQLDTAMRGLAAR
ncbi:MULTISPECIES: TetR/AcrR family transcriptional regulator [Thermomonosporaceae]|uniref:TetR/AcrR family transcriptional regulator n=1 Tax=Thermomonosporaceae TaxID=2012 RepID=UPI00255AED82|nr:MULTISPECIES: TetR/AcrR family transcriptional regulator [Thermomonosporaceae]MDL4771180.1 helix-turn-helix domain-containing protein [Actinomadura xylanilytica]